MLSPAVNSAPRHSSGANHRRESQSKALRDEGRVICGFVWLPHVFFPSPCPWCCPGVCLLQSSSRASEFCLLSWVALCFFLPGCLPSTFFPSFLCCCCHYCCYCGDGGGQFFFTFFSLCVVRFIYIFVLVLFPSPVFLSLPKQLPPLALLHALLSFLVCLFSFLFLFPLSFFSYFSTVFFVFLFLLFQQVVRIILTPFF